MPVPYRQSPRPIQTGRIAYLDVIWLRQSRMFCGGLLVLDGKGLPLEFAYNSLVTPAGFLWPEEAVRQTSTSALAHTLFDACQCEPDLLVCLPSLGTQEFCNERLGVSIPFAQILQAAPDASTELSWISNAPTSGMPAHALAFAMASHGFALEPFDRLRAGLCEVYPEAPWPSVTNDSPSAPHH